MVLSAYTQHALMWGIFALSYIGIALGRFPGLVLDRTGVAILGAIGMLLVHGVSISQAAALVDHETMLLLFALMIFSAQLRVAGFYGVTGQLLTRLTQRPRTLLAGLIVTSGLLSSLLANDIVCLALTPLLCSTLLAAGRNPLPYLLALAMSSNIGSAATIIGNPQNMYIGAVADLSFGHFTLIMLPVVVFGLGLCWVGVVLLFRKELHAPASTGGAKMHFRDGDTLVPTSLTLETRPPERDDYLIAKSLVLLAGLVGVFLFARGEGRAIAALVGAGILLCSRRAKAARLYRLVDWNLILLFLGLFVINGAMQQQGLADRALAEVAGRGLDLRQPVTLATVTLVLSNLVSNVPAVLLLKPVIPMADQQLWYLLALVSTLAGNLTLVGSIANLIVAESAAAYGVRLDLRAYCRLGIPLTLVTVGAAAAWLIWVL
ncbi:MAG: anion transporter [Candidatus Eisenbacteria bacterium]